MAARKSRRRKGSARRKARRAGHAVARSNPPKRARRRARASARRNSPAGKRRSFRRNPPGGILTKLKDAAIDGASVGVGVIAQNLLVRNLPAIVPATTANAAQINGLIGDIGGIVLGAFVLDKALGADRARMVVAGQAWAAMSRQLRTMNIPTISTALGDYDPARGVGTYTNGLVRPPVRAALPAGRGNNVSTLKGVGIYTDGMSSAPSLF